MTKCLLRATKKENKHVLTVGLSFLPPAAETRSSQCFCLFTEPCSWLAVTSFRILCATPLNWCSQLSPSTWATMSTNATKTFCYGASCRSSNSTCYTTWLPRPHTWCWSSQSKTAFQASSVSCSREAWPFSTLSVCCPSWAWKRTAGCTSSRLAPTLWCASRFVQCAPSLFYCWFFWSITRYPWTTCLSVSSSWTSSSSPWSTDGWSRTDSTAWKDDGVPEEFSSTSDETDSLTTSRKTPNRRTAWKWTTSHRHLAFRGTFYRWLSRPMKTFGWLRQFPISTWLPKTLKSRTYLYHEEKEPFHTLVWSFKTIREVAVGFLQPWMAKTWCRVRFWTESTLCTLY